MPAEEIFRHSAHRCQRRAVFAAFKRLPCVSPHRIDRFVNCGSAAFVQYNAEEDCYRVVGNYCHDRLCVACGVARSAQVAAAVQAGIGDTPVRFVTLTLKGTNALTLSQQIDRLYTCFRNFRRSTFGKANFAGGVAFFEVTVSSKTGLWHPHLHCLIEGQYVEKDDLSKAWHAITGDSPIVDIQRVGASADERGKAIRYASAYAGKPLGKDVASSPEHLDIFIPAIKGRQLVFTFGSWRKQVDLSSHPAINASSWVTIGSLSDLAFDATQGSSDAIRLLEVIMRQHNFREHPP